MHLAKFHFKILGVNFFHSKNFVKLESGCQKSFKIVHLLGLYH